MKSRSPVQPAVPILAGVLVLLGVSSAQAQTPEQQQQAPAQVQAQLLSEDFGNHLYDKFQVTLSGSILKLGSEIRIDAKNGSIGTDLDVEDDLGMPETKFQPRVAFRWKPGRKHELEVGYQFARRTASKTLERTIAVGDTTFDAGAQVDTKFDTDNAFLTYRYAFVADERKQFGVGLGLGAFFFDVGVDAVAGIGGGGSASYSGGASFVGPTAALGLFGRLRSGERWYFEPDVRYLRVTVDRFTAQVLEGNVATQYYVSPKVGIEAAVGLKSVEVDVGPKTDGGGIGPEVSALIKYTESQFRLGVVLPL